MEIKPLECIDRIEVLDKVKQLFLIPEMEVMTTKMAAAYFRVPLEAINSCYNRNKVEIDSDGVVVKRVDDFRIVQDEQFYETRIKGGIEFKTPELTFAVSYGKGIKVFPRRAILRIAMLLRDSEVAREVRTQLLNVVEHVTKNDLRVRSNGLRRR